MKPVFTYNRFGFFFSVYENRIEIHEGVYNALAKKTSILLKNVSSVTVVGLTRKLEIKTNDGKTFTYNVGTQSEDAKNAISNLL